MSIPNRQIGWNDRTNMLWNIAKELSALTCDVACKSTTTTTSSTTAQPVKYFEFEVESDIGSVITFNFSWQNSSAIDTITVDWGDGNIAATTVTGINTFTFTHTYSTVGTFIVILSFPVPVLDNTLQYSFSVINDDAPISYFNDGNIDFYYVSIYSKNPTLSVSLFNSTKLYTLNLLGYALGSRPVIYNLDLSSNSNLFEIYFSYIEIQNISLSGLAPLGNTFIDALLPIDILLETIIVSCDDNGAVSGSFVSYTCGTLSGGGLIAEANLIGKGWTVFVADRKSTRLNSSQVSESRMPSSA